MADIVAKRLVRYLERAGYVVKKPPLGGHSGIGRRFEGPRRDVQSSCPRAPPSVPISLVEITEESE